MSTTTADTITQTSAVLRGSFSASGVKATECGMYMGTSTGSLKKLGSDSISTYGTTMYYSTDKYIGSKALTPDTTYYYQAYAVVDGKEYKGNVKSFMTLPDTTSKPSVSVSLSQDSMTMKDNVSKTLTAMTTPGGLAVSWRSSDPSVATVTNGNITALKAGTTTITASVSSGGQTAFALCQVTVTPTQKTCTNHVKGEYLWYAELHPHYDYYICAVCGQQFRDTTTNNVPSCKICNPDPQPCTNHVKGRFLRHTVDHPHYNYYTCSVCGEQFTDRTTAYVSSCKSCNPVNTYGISLSGLKASNITTCSVRLDASCSYMGSRPTSVGVFLGTSPDNLQVKDSDGNINHNKNPFDIWYNLSGLTAGTTYYYRFYAVVDGKLTFSETKSFATSVAK